MSKLERLLQYQSLLSTKALRTSAWLMKELGVSRPTLQRDLKELEIFYGVKVIYDRFEQAYRIQRDEEWVELPNAWFSKSELSGLAVLCNLVEKSHPELVGDKLKQIKARVENQLNSGTSPKNQSHGPDPDKIFIQSLGRPLADVAVFEKVAMALFQNQRLSISYTSRTNDEAVQRHVSPKRLALLKGNWYLFAWCHLRDKLLQFSLDRIVEPEILEEAAMEVDTETVNAQLPSGFGVFGGAPTATVTLQLSEFAARWARDRPWHPQQDMKDLPDGGIELSFPYANEDEMLAEVLRHGAHVRVLGPESLRDRVRQELQLMVGRYGV